MAVISLQLVRRTEPSTRLVAQIDRIKVVDFVGSRAVARRITLLKGGAGRGEGQEGRGETIVVSWLFSMQVMLWIARDRKKRAYTRLSKEAVSVVARYVVRSVVK